MKEIIHKDLSYNIVGVLFEVFRGLGGGFQEKYYQKALKRTFIEKGIPFLEQVRVDLNYKGKFLGRYYLDFIIDNKVVLEIKAKYAITRTDIIQVLNYLKQSNLELGIISNFTRDGVKIKRILRGGGAKQQ